MNTKYWKRMKTFFANKCEEQKDLNDNRTLRQYYNPKTKQDGEVYEYQTQDLDGLVESFYIEEQEWDGVTIKNICMGLQGDGFVNVVKFALFQSGQLSKDAVKIARICQNIDFSKELTVSIWEAFKLAKQNDKEETKVPVYLLFKQDDGSGKKYPPSIKSFYDYDEEAKKWIGLPEVEKTQGIDGSDEYNSKERDKFLYDILNKCMEDNKSLIEGHKNDRPTTPAEEAAAETALAGNVEDESDVPF